MIAQKKQIKKPVLTSHKPEKKTESLEQKIKKIETFYRYRLPSIYRQLRKQVYQVPSSKQIPVNKPKNGTEKGSFENTIEILYKKVMLNSKYHHREKMRFSRMPLLKSIKYDFQALNEKLKSKAYCKIYDDLEEEDDEDEGKEKKQYEADPHFNEESIIKYKKKHGIDGKIVSALGYEDLKERLISEYGWTENPDTTSLIYDYKHMSKKKDIDYVNILDGQAVNHYNENKSITAKFGLTRNIRNLSSLGKDMSKFFPRCFDVNDVAEFENFFESFKETYVESIVKQYIRKAGKVPKQMRQISDRVIGKCLHFCERRLLPVEKKVMRIGEGEVLIIALQDLHQIMDYDKKMMKRKGNEGQDEEVNEELFSKALKLDEIGSQVDPQWRINSDNIWIVKPASLSRGRGIKTFNNLTEIIDYIIGKQISWVVQKYIENPLIIRKKKFDIRQWVLLTDLKPFRVWSYDECYIRFCAIEYTPENLKNRKVHLTNNSVTKGMSQITGDGIEENMMSQQQFSDVLKQISGKDVFSEKIRPQMDRISVQSLESVKENIINRKNTMEVFGFDFMVDEDFKVWLIEVNSSPTMEKSTKLTEMLVERGMSDYGDLVNNYLFKGKNYKGSKRKQLYGGWRLLTD